MKKTTLRQYAKLIVRCGMNVQKGQEVLIRAELDQPEFVQMVVEECYKAKAKEVTVQWGYQPLSKIHVRYKSVKTMGEVKEWEKARQQHYCDALPCTLYLTSEDPDGLKVSDFLSHTYSLTTLSWKNKRVNSHIFIS